TYSKSVGGIQTNTPQTPEEKAAELAAFDQKLYKVQLAMNESMPLVPWREDRAHIAPVTDIIDSISRAAPITPLDVHQVPYNFPDQVCFCFAGRGRCILAQGKYNSYVVYNNTTVTGSLMGHQIFQDVYNQVIRQALLVVRVPRMAHRRVKEIDFVVRVPVPDHLGSWYSAHRVFEKLVRFYPNVIELYLVGPCAPSPIRSPYLFMHGITGVEDHEHIIPEIMNALQDKNLKEPCKTRT
ncbi:hypothetical protein D6D11_10758, partial [Aureobasidium pullulans]